MLDPFVANKKKTPRHSGSDFKVKPTNSCTLS